MKPEFYSTIEAAKLMRISRIAVFRQIKSGRLVAHKIGRNYAIPRDEVEAAIGSKVSPKQADEIKRAVRKTMDEYGDVLKKLGKE